MAAFWKPRVFSIPKGRVSDHRHAQEPNTEHRASITDTVSGGCYSCLLSGLIVGGRLLSDTIARCKSAVFGSADGRRLASSAELVRQVSTLLRPHGHPDWNYSQRPLTALRAVPSGGYHMPSSTMFWSSTPSSCSASRTASIIGGGPQR